MKWDREKWKKETTNPESWRRREPPRGKKKEMSRSGTAAVSEV